MRSNYAIRSLVFFPLVLSCTSALSPRQGHSEGVEADCREPVTSVGTSNFVSSYGYGYGNGTSPSRPSTATAPYVFPNQTTSSSNSSASVPSTTCTESVASSRSTSDPYIMTTWTMTGSAHPSVSPTAVPSCYYWMEDIEHQGIAPFNSNSEGYQVFRNVKDFGAKGDGQTDDTDAINLAIVDGGRCGPGGGCNSSTTSPAVVYFPPGEYLVSEPIIDYYMTNIIGNPNCAPVLKASSSYKDRFLIDGDTYGESGSLGWVATNVFWRQIRNLVIDLTAVNSSLLLSGIHWPTAQATSLQNIVFKMSEAPETQHEGVFIEEGSGGFMSDLTFYGGNIGMHIGNQQFTTRNLTFHNSNTAIMQLWDWGWTYQGVSINNCKVGLNMTALGENGYQTVASVTFIDSEINDTPVGITMARNDTSIHPSGGSLILENIRTHNVSAIVEAPGHVVVLPGSNSTLPISAWGQGHEYLPNGPATFQGTIDAHNRPLAVTSGTDLYVRSKPQYETLSASDFVSVRTAGAAGDGQTDDTEILNEILAGAAVSGKVVYFDAGYYRVTCTLHVPAGARVVGEAYAVILSSGDFFADMDSPRPVVQVGQAGQTGVVEWSDMVVSTRGAQAGAVLIEYNLASAALPAGMWDVHTRVGGFAGSELQAEQCRWTNETGAAVRDECVAAFMSMHVTAAAGGLYVENCWLWVADHDVEEAGLARITVYAGRGLLVESRAGRVWLVGTGVEHHVLYEYQLVGTRGVVMGQAQTETAYYQPNPDARTPFPPVPALHDPVFEEGQAGWALRVVDSDDVLVYGAGLYSFFSNYDVSCSGEGSAWDCQTRVLSVENSEVSVYNLNTVGVTQMATVDGRDVAGWGPNYNGFVDTIALLRTHRRST